MARAFLRAVILITTLAVSLRLLPMLFQSLERASFSDDAVTTSEMTPVTTSSRGERHEEGTDSPEVNNPAGGSSGRFGDGRPAPSTVMAWLNCSDGVHETYLLSAFWDDRWQEVGETFISSLVLMKTGLPLTTAIQLYVFVHCADEGALNPQVYEANMTEVHALSYSQNKDFFGTEYSRVVLPCRAERCRKPLRLTLRFSAGGVAHLDGGNSVPVEYPATAVTDEFTICVPPIFGCLDARGVIEWMEMQKILGVTRVVIHNNTQCAGTSRVFEHYAAQGLVDLRQDRTILPADGAEFEGLNRRRLELFLRDPLMLTDCMYRHMYDAKYTFFIDIDEVLVPTKSMTLRQMMKRVEATPSPTGAHFSQFTFRNFFFLLDDLVTPEPSDPDVSNATLFLRYRKRLGPSPRNKRRKSIVVPRTCEYVNNHYCATSVNKFKPAAPDFEQLLVPPSIGKVHHYRSTSCTVNKMQGKTMCEDGVPSEPVINDDEMLKYGKQLLSNLSKRMAILAID